ncbi:hypothetical protein L226DRAFT_130343 [Lentinus tigrinus ALCF2SS1-7]|uniref:Uncharacterized protein n=1 Tax=Lentinus tigrinus ALCF2SS1-6 TaxID=1328759 RepID=A0A5C2SU79_9APHY|nr:hypothetical protein L227DRAFT_17066 [Lentinus tigrinus ALCF2SS1-6]RPD81131.1 hypothetical protein L226DRAFT_130343 [Lentinus tigrinus ALCF2SS1-7]
MRRIAAVFASKRTDRSDAASSTTASATTTPDAPPPPAPKPSSSKRFFRSLSRKSKAPVGPVADRLNSTELHPPSSSSSSSGAPTTPDDDRGSLLRAPANKAWLPLPPVDPRLGSFHNLEPAPHDRSRFSLPPPPPATPSTLDTEEDDSSTEESSLVPPDPPPKAPERAVPLTAPEYLLALTSNNLRLPYAPPPLLHVPGRPMFPRSCNPRRNLHCSDCLETTMHRKKLQRRLQRRDLSPAEARSIAPFAGRRNVIKEHYQLYMDDVAVREGRVQSHSLGLKRWAERPCFEDRMHVLLSENIPSNPHSEPQWTRVAPATGFGVAALEFSVTLELLADLYEDNIASEYQGQSLAPDASALGYLRLDTQLTLDLAPALSQSPTTLSPSSSVSPPSPATMPSPTSVAGAQSPKQAQSSSLPPSQSRGQTYRASPSPLRMEAASASPRTPSALSPVSSAASTTVAFPARPASSAASPPPPSASSHPPPLKSALKQGVRFAEEEKEDQVPLDYVMRIKRKREEKARFLQAERQRRKYDEERRQHEEEKRKWEEERAAWEREKHAIEEERKKKIYADELVAARSRRDSQRYGFGAMAGEGLATGQWDRNERPRPEREGSSSSYLRPAYDPAAHPHMPRSNSDLLHPMPKPSRQGSSSGSGSPGDSRPNSVYGSGSTPGSRPPSMHSGVPTPSSSQQDVRSRERRMSNTGSRRGSMVSEGGGGSWRQSQHVPIPPLPPVWPMNMSPTMPMPMSAMPMAMPMQMSMQMPMQMQMPQMYGMGMDMPLLPPSPPFMMQQYGPRSPGQSSSRSHSPQRSHSSSPTLGRQNLPASGSSERVNRMSQVRGSSASARAPSLPRSESSPRRAHHQRTSSGEIPPRPPAQRNATSDDRRSPRSSAPSNSGSHRPHPPSHSSSLPPHPPPAFSQARSSWAMPQTGFENTSRPNTGRRQTMIS